MTDLIAIQFGKCVWYSAIEILFFDLNIIFAQWTMNSPEISKFSFNEFTQRLLRAQYILQHLPVACIDQSEFASKNETSFKNVQNTSLSFTAWQITKAVTKFILGICAYYSPDGIKLHLRALAFKHSN